jgi:hypothetical protein
LDEHRRDKRKTNEIENDKYVDEMIERIQADKSILTIEVGRMQNYLGRANFLRITGLINLAIAISFLVGITVISIIGTSLFYLIMLSLPWVWFLYIGFKGVMQGIRLIFTGNLREVIPSSFKHNFYCGSRVAI